MSIIFANDQLVQNESQERAHESPVVTVGRVPIGVRHTGGVVVTDTARTVNNEYQVDHSVGTATYGIP